jgi:hypothetical protein
MPPKNSGSPESELEKIGTVIARSLAYLCLQNSEVKNQTVLEKAKFLGGFGIPFADAAQMLGSTAESLRVMAYTKGKKGKGKSSGKKSKS